MKLLFVISDEHAQSEIYWGTGCTPGAPCKRAVEIELTEAQVKQLDIREIGPNCGKPYMENIESISLTPEVQK